LYGAAAADDPNTGNEILLIQETFHFDVRHIKLQNFSSTTEHRSNAAKPKVISNALASMVIYS
jgi:hypothetical protein